MAVQATTGLLKIFSFPEFFAAAAESLAGLLGADGVALIVYDGPEQLRYKLFHGLEQLNQTPIVKFSFSASEGTVGRALVSGQALFTPDYPHSADSMPDFVAAGLRANLVVPLPGPAGFNGAIAVAWLHHEPAPPQAPQVSPLPKCSPPSPAPLSTVRPWRLGLRTCPSPIP
ncbi:GAF domain-containing protein [Acidocella sp. MX-AZ03]|uniref:GAF domain-containing protein n=1 Tax=Acidocella sp. MX-AZ03 TaxID=2697363 RepID=UPI002FD85EB8